MEATGSTKFNHRFLSTSLFFTFWERHPALLYALAALIGCAAALSSKPLILLLPFLLVAGSLLLALQTNQMASLLRVISMIVVTSTAYVYCHSHYLMPKLPLEGVEGTAFITMTDLSDFHSSFGPAWLLQGTVKSFVPTDSNNESIARNIPYRITLSAKEGWQRPLANQSYAVRSRLKRSPQGSYYLSVKKDADWHPIDKSYSLAEMRYHAKKTVSAYIYDHIADTRCAGLLVGLLTGDLSDRQTQLSLGRFGLQHLLAISGFHFAILAGILAAFLGLFLPYRWIALALLTGLSLYCLFLGYGPSIMRAYITACVLLAGQLLRRPARALNSMGVAMGAILLYDPTSSLSPAFQMSFLATAAILLLYQPLDHLLRHLWLRRPLSELVEMTRLDQHAYILLALCRQALALTAAVHLVTVPLCLYYFQKFPLLSLAFNIFFPFLISISVILLLAGSAIYLALPWIGQAIHSFNSSFTQTMLNLTFNTPTNWDITLRTEVPAVGTLIALLCLILTAGIVLNHQLAAQRQLRDDLNFL